MMLLLLLLMMMTTMMVVVMLMVVMINVIVKCSSSSLDFYVGIFYFTVHVCRIQRRSSFESPSVGFHLPIVLRKLHFSNLVPKLSSDTYISVWCAKSTDSYPVRLGPIGYYVSIFSTKKWERKEKLPSSFALSATSRKS